MASPPLKYLTRKTAFQATTKNPATTHFNHLRSFPRGWLVRMNKFDPRIKSVRPADRIKWWNIVPGDQIRLRGDKESVVHEVLSINRLSNRVFLKNTSVRDKDMLFWSFEDHNAFYFRVFQRKTNQNRRKTITTPDASCILGSMKLLQKQTQIQSHSNRLYPFWLKF